MTSYGQPVTKGRQIDADNWVGVYPGPAFGDPWRIPGVDPAELNGLLQETSVG
jgi:hypothetical protein